MSAGDASKVTPAAAAAPDSLEVVPGFAHARIEGWTPELATTDELREALEKALDYRGDVTITRREGAKVEGYIFDRRNGSTLENSVVRLIPKDGTQKISIAYADIAALNFSGRDTASGKSWEAWVRKYWEKRAAGEQGIRRDPDDLDTAASSASTTI